MVYSRYVIQREGVFGWEDLAHPFQDTLEDVVKSLNRLREQESKKKYQRAIRVVKQTTETIDI
jgi:hypothetical protein